MATLTRPDPTTTRLRDAGLLLLRLGVGGTLVAHGTQKLFGWFGGGGLDGTAKGMAAMGFHPPRLNALAAGAGEAGGGALVALGLATPAAGAAAAGTMVAAAAVHRPNGFFAQQGGLEYPAVLGLSAAALALTGPGDWSVDKLLGHRVNRPGLAALSLLASATGSALVLRRRTQALSAAETYPQGERVDEAVEGVEARAE